MLPLHSTLWELQKQPTPTWYLHLVIGGVPSNVVVIIYPVGNKCSFNLLLILLKVEFIQHNIHTSYYAKYFFLAITYSIKLRCFYKLIFLRWFQNDLQWTGIKKSDWGVYAAAGAISLTLPRPGNSCLWWLFCKPFAYWGIFIFAMKWWVYKDYKNKLLVAVWSRAEFTCQTGTL